MLLAMLNENNTGHSQPSLPLEIRTATRAKHDVLNRLITARICLCLPPCTQNPQLYALGLSVCGSIYTAFESEWMRFLDRRKTDTPRMVDILQTVYIPNLLRMRNLENELVNLKPCSPNRTTLENASKVIGAHQNTIRTAIRAKPHVVLAYAWVMYMALFNGGRIIRAQLSGALPEFWECSKTPPNSEEGVHVTRSEHLQFWDFDDGRDGDNVKEELRKRVDTAAAQLTVSERVDVVDEAVRIYERLHELVDWLDANAHPGTRLQSGNAKSIHTAA